MILYELHDTHPGINKMKALARAYVWWPGMDAQMTDMVKTCPVCQESRPSPVPAPMGVAFPTVEPARCILS